MSSSERAINRLLDLISLRYCDLKFKHQIFEWIRKVPRPFRVIVYNTKRVNAINQC